MHRLKFMGDGKEGVNHWGERVSAYVLYCVRCGKGARFLVDNECDEDYKNDVDEEAIREFHRRIWVLPGDEGDSRGLGVQV